jgi:ATP-dependent RNA helicase RhlE
MSTSAVPFSSLGLSHEALQALSAAGYTHPTPIQARAIPPVMEGEDVIGCAATGTGKTAAFVLPILEKLAGKKGTRALVLAPTRELAVQIEKTVQQFSRGRGMRSVVLIGGVGMDRQTTELRNEVPIIIATPGRLVDHMAQGNAKLDGIEILVLDEADRMLDMGFKPQLTKILARVPRQRQTLLFSATMATEVEEFAGKFLKNPVRIEVTRSGTTAKRASQLLYEVTQNEKVPLLLELLRENPTSTLVFTRTKRRADRLLKAIVRAGLSAARIHSDRSQAQRLSALEGFRHGRYRVLIATDIAARGIDVKDIGHVVNFDLPHVAEDYVHRVGRTARAAASGSASSFGTDEDKAVLKDIEKLTGAKLQRGTVPRNSAHFQEELRASAARQAHPGPKREDHGISKRPPGSPLGRHARTHAKKPSTTERGGEAPRHEAAPASQSRHGGRGNGMADSTAKRSGTRTGTGMGEEGRRSRVRATAERSDTPRRGRGRAR